MYTDNEANMINMDNMLYNMENMLENMVDMLDNMDDKLLQDLGFLAATMTWSARWEMIV